MELRSNEFRNAVGMFSLILAVECGLVPWAETNS